ncbi:MAG: hypothetical protein AAF340_10655 [Pseudomonadota bacterium]
MARSYLGIAVLALCMAGCGPSSQQSANPESSKSGARISYEAELPVVARACLAFFSGNTLALEPLKNRGYIISGQQAELNEQERLLGETRRVTVKLGQTDGSLNCKSSYAGQVGFGLYRDFIRMFEKLGFEQKKPNDGAIFERGDVTIRVNGKGRSATQAATFTLTKL